MTCMTRKWISVAGVGPARLPRITKKVTSHRYPRDPFSPDVIILPSTVVCFSGLTYVHLRYKFHHTRVEDNFWLFGGEQSPF